MARAIRGWVEVSGPVTPEGLGETLGFDASMVRAGLIALEGEGLVLRGRFTPDIGDEEFCDRRILARIQQATIARLRQEIEPVPATTFLAFLFSWQHLEPSTQLEGESGLLEVVEQLQGFEAASGAWEEEILRARVHDYQPAMLDSLCLLGEVTWGRWSHRITQAEVPAHRPGLHRTGSISLGMRADVSWLLDGLSPDENALSAAARSVLAFLREHGASFFPEIVSGTRQLPTQVEDALWQLVAAGLVTADAFEGLRALVSGEAKRWQRSPRRRRGARPTRVGRWSLLSSREPAPENRKELWARQYLRRYGVLLRELLTRESMAPPWRDLLPVLRRMEARGEIRGGRFVAGCAGEQFAIPEAVDVLRAVRRRDAAGRFLRLSACDPLNLVGIITPGARVPALLGNRLVYRDGLPIASVEAGEMRLLSQIPTAEWPTLERLLDPRPASAFDPANLR
jgi:ATP-dependent Lhr-like helicase